MSVGPISPYDQWKLSSGPYETLGEEAWDYSDDEHDDDCDCGACVEAFEDARHELREEQREKIGRDEFTESWCRESGITVEDLSLHGLRAVPCDCDYPSCQGWAMTSFPPEFPRSKRGEDEDDDEG